VGQGPLEPAFDAGRPGLAGGGGGDLAGLAMLGHDHGEAQLGQGVDLMAVSLGEQFGPHLGPPIAYLVWGAHGSAPGGGGPTLPDANPWAPPLTTRRRWRVVSPRGEGGRSSYSCPREARARPAIPASRPICRP